MTEIPRIIVSIGNGKIYVTSEIPLQVLILAHNEGIELIEPNPQAVERGFNDYPKRVAEYNEYLRRLGEG